LHSKLRSMAKFFVVDGYWKDDKSSINGYIVTDMDSSVGYPVNGLTDEDIFFYGLNELEIQEAIELGEDTVQDFVITTYREY